MTWETWVFVICIAVSLLCKLGSAILEADTKEQEVKNVPLNRQQRRHPDGMIPAQRFQRVSVKGRQKQGRGKAVRGW